YAPISRPPSTPMRCMVRMVWVPRAPRSRIFFRSSRFTADDAFVCSHMINLLDFDRSALIALFAERGEKPFRAVQTLRWIHRGLTDRVDAMTDLAKST